jgi:gluconate kinase
MIIGVVDHTIEGLKKLEEAKNRSNVKESKKALYHKFKFLEQSKNTISYRLKKRVGSFINKTLNLQKRDLEVIGQLVFMKIYDPIITINKPYHFIQKVPEKFLKHQENPYRHLVDTL